MGVVNLQRGAVIDAAGVRRIVVINGEERGDCVVPRVVQSAGLAPGTAELRFPTRRFAERVLAIGDTVEVYVSRDVFPLPLFRGVVIGEQASLQAGVDEPVYLAADVRRYLGHGVCSRSFNERWPNGSYRERLNSREIVTTIVAEAQAFAAAAGVPALFRVDVSLGSVPLVEMGFFDARGVPHGEALERLLAGIGASGVRRWKLEYQAGANVISAFVVGSGLGQYVVRGIDPALGRDAQPYGRVMVGEATEAREGGEVVNEVQLESHDVVMERRVALTPAWAGAGTREYEGHLQLVERASTLQLLGQDLSETQAVALDTVGRRFRIPDVVDIDGIAKPLQVASEMVQTTYYGDSVWDKIPNGPFLAWQTHDDTWRLLFDGWTIDGRYVITDAPIYNAQIITEPRAAFTATMSINMLEWRELSGAQIAIASLPGYTLEQLQAPGAVRKWDPDTGTYNVAQLVLETSPATPRTPGANEVAYDVEAGGFVGPFPGAEYGIFTTRRYVKRTLPTVYLNAGWQSLVPLTATSGKQGGVGLHVKRLATVGGYRRRRLADHIRVQEAGTDDQLGVTQGTGTLVTSGVDTINESAGLEVAAQARARQFQEALRVLTRELPGGELGWEIGAVLWENLANTRCSIVEIVYDLVEMRTRITAASR